VARRAAELMPDGGSLVTLTYGGSNRVTPFYNVMGVAKAALEASVRYLANDLGPQQIRVNAISPGPMKTLAGAAIGGARKTYRFTEANAPLRRNATLEAVGGAAVFLCSDYGACTTGDVIMVDSRLSRAGHAAAREHLKGAGRSRRHRRDHRDLRREGRAAERRAVVARAWTDPDFADWLRRDATAAIASMGFTGRQGEHMQAVFNTPDRAQPRRLHALLLLPVAGAGPAAGLVQVARLPLARRDRPARRAGRVRRDAARDDAHPRLGFDGRAALSGHPDAPRGAPRAGTPRRWPRWSPAIR
jgi:hypothetical protein